MLVARFTSSPPALTADLSHAAWQQAPPVTLDRTWRGDAAPAVLATTARLVWTPAHLWVGFDAGFIELDADVDYDTSVERHGLWERDVCEAFVQCPREPHDRSYKEFEVAPTGQWCDLAIHEPRVEVDIEWQSGMETAATVDLAARRFVAVMRIPFAAFGGAPSPGDRWRGNLFRIGRVSGERQYLAYAPTGTATPDFHVPRCFVPLIFEGRP
jgi:hypothetical protein